MGSEIARALTRADEKELLGAMVAELRAMRATQTDLMAHIRGGIANGVLLSELITLDANGQATRTFNVSAGSIVCVNLSESTDIILASSSAQATAPQAGPGVQKISAGTFLTVPLASSSFTVYGTAGEQVNVQVFTGLQAFAGGPVR